MSARHRWTLVAGLTTTYLCERCGFMRQQRPHPYARRWFVEYTRDADVFDKAPPCDNRLAAALAPDATAQDGAA